MVLTEKGWGGGRGLEVKKKTMENSAAKKKVHSVERNESRKENLWLLCLQGKRK